MVSTVSMKLGETRNVTISVQSTCCQPFEVTDATWELQCGDETDDSGDCEIEDITNAKKYLTARIKPQRKNAMFLLRFKYTIVPETFIYDVRVRVT